LNEKRKAELLQKKLEEISRELTPALADYIDTRNMTRMRKLGVRDEELEEIDQRLAHTGRRKLATLSSRLRDYKHIMEGLKKIKLEPEYTDLGYNALAFLSLRRMREICKGCGIAGKRASLKRGISLHGDLARESELIHGRWRRHDGSIPGYGIELLLEINNN